ncbi:AAA family ATPase [Pontibacter flavimaris]|uniref:HTH cro/C1-type domain-containing protein n=1 Tax=Pontibacter flavimaris TaxID=1797110 RepID=A0A1Q5PDF1_9BACT|nr:AAA family ATPase [Pontibacter flavimaris]OKL40275.1 hypothetical protein A3841_18290 [Pontibacter flavimaris]
MQKENLIQQARQLINDFTGKKELSKSKLARKLGIAAAVLTHIENNPALVSEEMLLTIINGLKPESSFNILSTSNYTTVHAICEDARQRRKLVGIIGYPGAGKTTALQSYYRSHKNIYYVECKNSMNRKQFLHAVLTEMGIQFMGTVYDMVRLISQELNSKESPLLIIDEAGKMSPNLILDLHDLRNATMHNAGIVMSGCEYFKKNMEKAAEKDKQGYPEFYSRVMNWPVLNRPTKAEIVAISKSNGIQDEETIKALCRLRNYRELENAIKNELSEPVI